MNTKRTLATIVAAAIIAWIAVGAVVADRIIDAITTEATTPLGAPAGFSEITIDGAIGQLDGIVSTAGPIWLIGVHGLTETPSDTVDLLAIGQEWNMSTMAVTYRNQPVGPRTDGVSKFGPAEWTDLEAAVRHADREGATSIVLAGRSHGGSVIASFLHWSPLAETVDAVILDAPALDLPRIIDAAIERSTGRLHTLISPPARWFMTMRGFDFELTSLDAQAPDFRVPVLLFHGDADEFVPVEISRELSDMVETTYIETPGADHVGSYDVDPATYRTAVTDFLTRNTPGQ